MNTLLLLVDQWPAWAMGRPAGVVATPNVNRLAARGTRFTNAFTSCPLCTPARAALLTGRWACRTGVLDNYGVGYSTQAPLPAEERTWLDAAVGSGRHVGYFGKWHLGPDGPIERGAHRHDEHFDTGSGPYDPRTSEHSYEHADRQQERARARLVRGRPAFWGEARDPSGAFDARDRQFGARAVAFLDEWSAGGRRRPFFLTLSCFGPHFPHYLAPEDAALAGRLDVTLPANIGDTFAGKPPFHGQAWWPSMDTSVLSEKEWRTTIAFSRAHITAIDRILGRVLDALDRLGIAEETSVIFAADHGDMEGAHNRFDKGPYFYEEVWRIPLVVRQPGERPGVSGEFVSLLDVGETLFGLAGAGRDGSRFGRDLRPLLGGRPAGWPREAFGAYDLYNGMSFAVRAARDERWKYVWNPQSVDELYDLETDPHELTNLAGRPESAAVQERLRSRLFAWMSEVGDDLPERADELPAAGTILAAGRMGP